MAVRRSGGAPEGHGMLGKRTGGATLPGSTHPSTRPGTALLPQGEGGAAAPRFAHDNLDSGHGVDGVTPLRM
eukprot:359219-Chlamydomonas_euryale.AAC.1